MCGRVKLEGDFSELKVRFDIPDDCPAPNYAASWNVAPTDKLPIVRYNPKTEARALDLMRWGLVPYWAKDIKIGVTTINAMAERAGEKLAGCYNLRLEACGDSRRKCCRNCRATIPMLRKIVPKPAKSWKSSAMALITG